MTCCTSACWQPSLRRHSTTPQRWHSNGIRRRHVSPAGAPTRFALPFANPIATSGTKRVHRVTNLLLERRPRHLFSHRASAEDRTQERPGRRLNRYWRLRLINVRRPHRPLRHAHCDDADVVQIGPLLSTQWTRHVWRWRRCQEPSRAALPHSRTDNCCSLRRIGSRRWPPWQAGQHPSQTSPVHTMCCGPDGIVTAGPSERVPLHALTAHGTLLALLGLHVKF